MPNPFALVGLVDSIVDSPESPSQVAIQFAMPNATAYLARSLPQFEQRRWMLQRLRDLGHPVYVSLLPGESPGAPVIGQVLMPVVGRVVAIEPDSQPGLARVRLDASCSRHVTRWGRPEDILRMTILLMSMRFRTVLFITADPTTHEIFDVREAFEEFQRERPRAENASTGRDALDDISVVPAQDVARIVTLVKEDGCLVPAPAEGCNTFVYPDDGCWARANRICELLAALPEKLIAAKVWLYGDLDVATRNHPFCRVRWDWHCAALIRVEPGELRVLDPSLFSEGVVPYKTFRGALSGITAVRFTNALVYKMATPDDPRGEIEANETEQALEEFRVRLIDRVNGSHGSPPYSDC